MFRYAVFVIIVWHCLQFWNYFSRVQSAIVQEFVNLICLPDYLVDEFGFFPSLYNMDITMVIHLVNCAVMIYPFPSAQSRDVFGFPSVFFCSHCHCDSPVYTWNYSVQGTWLLQSSPHSGLHKALTIPIVISVILSSHIMCASWFIRPPPGYLCMVVSVTIEIYTLFCLMQVAGVSLQRVGARQPGQWRERR